MLDNDKQLAAFRELNKTPFSPAASVTTARSALATAQTESIKLAAAVSATISYPPNVAGAIKKIVGVIEKLNAAATAAGDFAEYFKTFQSPSELLNVNIGWECHLRGNALPQNQSPGLVAAMEDKTVLSALITVLKRIDSTAVVVAMNEVNALFSIGVTVSNSSGAAIPAPPVTVSDELAKRLATACSSLENTSQALTGANSAVTSLTINGKSSVDIAKKAFSNAVGVSLLDSMMGSTTMSGAISAITPATVLSALKGKP